MTLPNRRIDSERESSKTYFTNLILHFLFLVESPINFILSIVGFKRFLYLGEKFLLFTEYARVKQEYLDAVNSKFEQHMESIRLATKANQELSKAENQSHSRIDE